MADTRFFDNHGPYTLGELADLTAGTLLSVNHRNETIRDIDTLSTQDPGCITVFHNIKYKETLETTQARFCILNPSHKNLLPKGVIPLFSDTPYRSFAKIAQHFYPHEGEQPFSFSATTSTTGIISETAKVSKTAIIHPTACIGPDAVIEENVVIGPYAAVGRGVVIGEGSSVGAHVSLSHTIIGKKVILHPGCRLGQRGFGFFMDEQGHVTVPQLGRVIIDDYVDIGANTTIDRGAGPDTRIGAGTRIDNLVQIAHNVVIGKGCVIVSQVGIAGSTEIGDYTVIAGQAGLTGHLKIGSRVQIAAQTGVIRNLADGAVVAGTPAVPARTWHRQTIALQRLVQKKKT